jgi:hypothetical protein
VLLDVAGPVWKQQKTDLDGHGRPTKITVYAQGSAPNDQITSFVYRADGTLQSISVPDPTTNNASVVTYNYGFDSLGRATSIRRPDSMAPASQSGVDVVYDGVTRSTTEVVGTAGGQPAMTKTTNDSFGRLKEVDERTAITPLTFAQTVYAYGPDDNVATITAPQGVITTLIHDFAGRRTKIARHGREWKYTYDANGNRIAEQVPGSTGPPTDPLFTTTIVYDDLDRPKSKSIAPRNLTPADRALFVSGTEEYEWDTGPNHKGYLRYWSAFAPGTGTSDLSTSSFNDNQGRTTSIGHSAMIAGYPNLSRAYAQSWFAFGGVKRSVLGRMAMTLDQAPRRAACGAHVAVAQPVERLRQVGDAPSIVIAARVHRRNVLGRHPVPLEEPDRRRRPVPRMLAEQRVRGQVLRMGHRDRSIEAGAKPPRVADMVGMAMRGDDAADRSVRERGREMALPDRARRVVAEAAIDEREPVVFREQPEIDVIERERERHPQPVHARRDLDHFAGRRERVVERQSRGEAVMAFGTCGQRHQLSAVASAAVRFIGAPLLQRNILGDTAGPVKQQRYRSASGKPAASLLLSDFVPPHLMPAAHSPPPAPSRCRRGDLFDFDLARSSPSPRVRSALRGRGIARPRPPRSDPRLRRARTDAHQAHPARQNPAGLALPIRELFDICDDGQRAAAPRQVRSCWTTAARCCCSSARTSTLCWSRSACSERDCRRRPAGALCWGCVYKRNVQLPTGLNRRRSEISPPSTGHATDCALPKEPLTPDPDFEDRVRLSFPPGRCARSARRSRPWHPVTRSQACPRPEISQQHGYVHAGAVAAIVDSAGGYAGYTLFPRIHRC